MSEQLFYIGKFGETVDNSDEKYLKEAEMFSTGVHRGVEYTEDDLAELAENFSQEENIPVQIDHSESALHTVGYLREAFSKGGKLMGKLEIIDKAIQERIDMGLMNKLSVSFYLKYTEEGFKPHKLREVSLVAFPQVKGARLFSENGYVSKYQEEEGQSMTQEQKQEFSEELLNKAKEKIEADLLEKYNEMEDKLEKLMGVEQKFNETQVEMKLEKFQEDNKVVPAQAEALKGLLNSFSEEQAQLFDEFMKNSQTADFQEQGEIEDADEKGERSQEQKDFDKFYEEYTKKHGTSL